MTYQNTLRDAPASLDAPLRVTHGEVPQGLRGTLFRNGPGAYAVGADRFHLLDAHAFVGAVVFDGGTPRFRGRVLDTPLRTSEVAAGKAVHRRIFTQSRRHLLDARLPDLAAHDLYVWGGRAVACDAPGHHALTAELAVAGPAPVAALRPSSLATFAPMPRVDATTGRLCLYVGDPGIIRSDVVAFYELDADWKTVHTVRHRLDRKAVLLHDLAVSPGTYVVPEFGHLDVPRVLGGRVPVFECVGFAPDHRARVFLFPRSGGPWRAVQLEGTEQVFHLFNAFEDGDSLVFDAAVYDRPVDFGSLAPPYAPRATPSAGARPVRFRVGPSGPGVVPATSVSRTEIDVRVDGPEVNPAFHGRPSRFGYAPAWTSTGDEPDPAAYFWYHGLTKIDFTDGTREIWDAGPAAYCSAPSFAPRAAASEPSGSPSPERSHELAHEDDGWLLAWVTHADHTELVILDARAVAAGPVVRLRLDAPLPPVSHAMFHPGAPLA